MAEVTEDAYQSIREFVVSEHSNPNEWDYITVYDDSEDEVTRIQISDDDRFDWVDLDGDRTVTVEGEITGSDSDIPTDGTTIEYVALHDSDSDGRRLTEITQVSALEFNQDGDTMEIEFPVEIPRE